MKNEDRNLTFGGGPNESSYYSYHKKMRVRTQDSCQESFFSGENAFVEMMGSGVLIASTKVVVSHIRRIGCQPEKNYFTRWPIPLVVC